MLRNIALSSAFVLAFATPAFADLNSCSEPYAPAAVDGKTATQDQMKHALDDVKNFIKDSDTYQDCVNNDVKAQQIQAKKDKKDFDTSIAADAKARIDRNQSDKEKVGAEFNAAVAAYNAKHPAPPPAGGAAPAH
jgi:hypothetical protein